MQTLINLFTPAFFIFSFLTILIWYINRGALLTSWDEFSHWGRVVKATYFSNQLSIYTNIDLGFRSYPPALSLFQYFLLSIRGAWNEADLIRSYSILSVILFLPFMRNLKFNSVKDSLSVIVLVILTPLLFFGNFYTSICIDAILALFFGYCLAEVYPYEKGNIFAMVRLCLGLAILPIIKESGMFFAFVVSVVIIFKTISRI